MLMGCYGIGVTRIVAAAIEQNHDKDGIVWPVPIAPYEVELVALQADDPKLTRGLRRALRPSSPRAGIEVLYDDRDERPGVKFKDADLIGIPYRIAVGKKGLVEGRRRGEAAARSRGSQNQDRRRRGPGGRRGPKGASLMPDLQPRQAPARPHHPRARPRHRRARRARSRAARRAARSARRTAVVLQDRPRAVHRRGRARHRAGAEAQRAHLPRPQAARHPRDGGARGHVGGAHRRRAADRAHLGRLRHADAAPPPPRGRS